MSGFLAFHRVAAARGDGLRPELLRLLEERAVAQAQTGIVELHPGIAGGFSSIAPCAGPCEPAFLPGNVRRLRPAAGLESKSERNRSTN